MDITEIKIGDRLEWSRVVSEWGHRNHHRVTVRKIGKRRVTIETDGGYRTSVEARSLFKVENSGARQ